MNFEIAKCIGSVLVSCGVGTVVSNACAHVTPKDVSRLGKMMSVIGAMALSTCVSNKVATYVEEEFDATFEKLKDDPEEIKEEA